MSQRGEKDTGRPSEKCSGEKRVISSKIAILPAINVAIGAANVERWQELKEALKCNTDEQFTAVLLDLAQKHAKVKTPDVKDNSSKQNNTTEPQENALPKKKEHPKTRQKKTKDIYIKTKTDVNQQPNNFSNILNVVNKCNSEVKNSKTNLVPANSILKKTLQNIKLEIPVNKVDFSIPNGEGTVDKLEGKQQVVKNVEKKSKKVDIIQKVSDVEVVQIDKSIKVKNTKNVETEETLSIKIKIACNCNIKHDPDFCPLQIPQMRIKDAIGKEEYLEKYSKTEDYEKKSFAFFSLPCILKIEDTQTLHGLSIFAKEQIKEFTQFGPLIGKKIKEVDISEDSMFKDIWEIYLSPEKNTYLNTTNLNDANWLKFIRPAPNRDTKNIAAISREDQLFFITTKRIEVDEELLYWQDDNFSMNKKKLEKSNCGGCNMNFTHPLYYRMHCSVFHDLRYSLTIRKYHCKVCGAAVLGKENIMKHAAELHNGQGAYQCQFCKKFFLRLNYLEMHRTYGCSANPHRTRPLCDFCGRKFCQPQKLKVHIKRMHSDMAEVLKEFQCKSCLKILGSRAALQRHLKEVHEKQIEGACACSRCGKLFQNKSNLKIHMLTHSGIKPFKCTEGNCLAAFTTKQCLQFHYKKVHAFTEDMMPKITRSVDYTFEAYSGDPENFEKPDESQLANIKDGEGSVSEVEENSMEAEQAVDDVEPIKSPVPVQKPISNIPESYSISNLKILSKGSKKWIGDSSVFAETIESAKLDESSNITLEVDDTEHFDQQKVTSNLSSFNRESSNASLLVEAALDSVCSEPNIDMDVSTSQNCTDALNLYSLSHDNLPDVTYSNNEVNESRDINLISPSVNDHISVTDDLNEELRHSQNIGLDYSTFHQEDFSPAPSPMQNRASFVRDYIVNQVSPTNNFENQKSPSPPRYDFNHINGNNNNPEHISSDDSNGIGVQNLSLHNPKDNIQLDLSLYKSYDFSMRKDFRSMKFDVESETRKHVYILDGETDAENLETNNLNEKDFEGIESGEPKHKEEEANAHMRNNKFELDLELRMKNYESLENDLRSRNAYELEEFRLKNYELESLENRSNLEIRNKLYDGLMETEFRPERNFEPLVLNSELQGLDMSARGYHNYTNLNRYHHLYNEVERPSVDLRLNYSPPPPTYSHADILRVVSLDLTPPGRHSVDLSLRTHQITNSRLLDHSITSSRLLGTDLGASRHLATDSRLLAVSDMSNRILSDHTTNRILSNDQIGGNRLLATEPRLLGDETRLITDQPRLLDQSRLLGEPRMITAPVNSGTISPVPYTPYSVSPSPYHPTALPPRPHATSPTPPYHHYSAYY